MNLSLPKGRTNKPSSDHMKGTEIYSLVATVTSQELTDDREEAANNLFVVGEATFHS